MYNVSSNFHSLAIADSPKTRCRIYFIGSGVNCWDDNDVQTNGTLLVGAAGDTDSNGRIGDGGVTFSEIYNKDQNLSVGGSVSYQIGMTLMNADGALDNFGFGRCKVYLDVYDSANSAWLACPMGVYNIEMPVKRKVQLISCTGYDQMQTLNNVADTWWSGLNFSGGLTIANILNSLVTELGLHLSSASSSAMVNSSLSFTSAPFDSVERTYRDILDWIAEATATIARFNRDGELDMRQLVTPQINSANIVIDTDTTGNQCLSVDIAEYEITQIDGIVIKLSETDQGVETGSSGTRKNKYTIWDNPFLYGASVAEIRNKLWPIYARLNQYGRYNPISIRLIADWSIEAGDIIYVLNDSTTYKLPIFQQKMVWRGGYVVSELISTGDLSLPKASAGTVRETYRYDCEMATKVGDNEIISKINQTPEQITIQASKVNLTGYVTLTNLSTAGQTSINGANIQTGTVTVSQMTSAAQAAINSEEQTIYISKPAGTTTVSANTTWVTNTSGSQNTWTLKRPEYNSSYPVLFVATQRKSAGGTVTCTTPMIDLTTTVIDGGHITTGTIDASVVSVTNLNASNISTGTMSANKISGGSIDASNVTITNLDASNITTGTMSANKISGGTLTVGGVNNTNGFIRILDATGNYSGSIGNNGMIVKEEEPIQSHEMQAWYGGYSASITDDTTNKHIGIFGTQIEDATDEYGQIVLHGYDNGTEVSTAELNAYPHGDGAMLSLQGPGGNTILKANGTYYGDLTLYGGNLTVGSVNGGVLDVVDRRCYAALSAVNWYRVLTYTGTNADDALGKDGRIFDIYVTRTYNNGNNEVHKISLFNPYNVFTFADETSRSNGQFIDKIRVMYNSSTYKTHVDIHYTHTLANYVTADFTMHGYPDDQIKCVAAGLSGVGPSPAGETEMALYTFAANGNNNFKTVTLNSQTITSGYFSYSDAAITANSKLQISQLYKSGEALGMFFILQPTSGKVYVYCRTGTGTLPADNSTISVFLTIDNR